MKNSSNPYAHLTESEQATFWIIVVVVTLVIGCICYLLRKSIYIVNHAEVIIMERFGKYHTTLKPGLHFVIPFVDTPRRVAWRYMDVDANNSQAEIKSIETDHVCLREHVIDFGLQHVITQDTVEMEIDALVYFRITDPRLAVLEVQNLPDAIELLTQATLRNMIATMTLDDTFSSREMLNNELLLKMRPESERWGVVITRVEIFDIQPGSQVKSAMESQIKAERHRRATVLTADGTRQATIIRGRGDAAARIYDATGDAAKSINESTGEASAKMLTAQAEAAEIEYISNVLRRYEGLEDGRAVDYITTLQWLRNFETLCQQHQNVPVQSSVILLPMETIDGVNRLIQNSDPNKFVKRD